MTRDTCRGSSEILLSKMGRNCTRPVGFVYNSVGLQVGIHNYTPIQRCQRNQSKQRKVIFYSAGSKRIVGETGFSNSTVKSEQVRFLYSMLFLVPKKTGGLRPVINLKP